MSALRFGNTGDPDGQSRQTGRLGNQINRAAQRQQVARLTATMCRGGQRQDSLQAQLEDLHRVAAVMGMYDAADWLWKQGRIGR